MDVENRDDIRPWDRWEGEDSKWFDRFDRFYRAQGPGRSLSEAYRQYYKEQYGHLPERPGYTTGWGNVSKEWKWQERAEAWDVEIRRARLEAEKEKSAEMAKRHIESAQAVQALALETIISKGITDTSVALRAWRQAVDVESKARGIPEHIAKVAELSDEQLRRELAKRLAGVSVRRSADQDGSGGNGKSSGGSDASGREGNGASDNGSEEEDSE